MAINSVTKLAWRLLRDPKYQALLAGAGPVVVQQAKALAAKGRWRQLAIVHADTVVDGSFARVPIAGEQLWVVWSGDEPVAAYPVYDGDLAEAVSKVDLTRRRKPDELTVRSAKRAARNLRTRASND